MFQKSVLIPKTTEQIVGNNLVGKFGGLEHYTILSFNL